MRQLFRFLTRYRHLWLLLVFISVGVARHSVDNPIASHRMNKAGFLLTAKVHSWLTGWRYYSRLSAVNEELARENAALRMGQNTSIAPSFGSPTAYQFLPARVLDYSYQKRNNYILIDIGTKSGVEPGMGVISNQGWVGTVEQASSNLAAVRPLLHAKGNIGGRIPNKGLCEIVWDGRSPHQATIYDVLREHEPTRGDSVFSFTRASVAPPTLVGIVTSSEQNPEDLSWKAKIELTTPFHNLSWVQVCTMIHKEEADTLELAP